jgi:hypothetical protein
MVPVADLGFQPGLHGGRRPLDAIGNPAPYFLQMRSGEPDPVVHSGVFQVSADPSAVDHMRQDGPLLSGGGTKVEVGRPADGVSGSLRVDADELEALGHDPAMAGLVGVAVDHRVL